VWSKIDVVVVVFRIVVVVRMVATMVNAFLLHVVDDDDFVVLVVRLVGVMNRAMWARMLVVVLDQDYGKSLVCDEVD
jgi:hypothetical protein